MSHHCFALKYNKTIAFVTNVVLIDPLSLFLLVSAQQCMITLDWVLYKVVTLTTRSLNNGVVDHVYNYVRK